MRSTAQTDLEEILVKVFVQQEKSNMKLRFLHIL